VKQPELQQFDELVRRDILEIGDGYRAKNEELGGNGPVFLRAAYLKDDGFTLINPDRFVANETGIFGKKISQTDDVVVTTKGNSIGRVGRIRREQANAVYSPHLSYWRSKSPKDIDQRFLYYWSLGSEFRDQLAGMAHSTDMAPYFSLRDQLRLKISLPGIDIQRAIGTLLSALDDKIELNRRMNETLEAMARALFRDWFVDFGPTRAKIEGRPAYLSHDIWSLFPGRIDDDDKPEGWSRQPLDQIAEFLNGLALQKFPAETGRPSLPVVKIAELRSGISANSNRASYDLPSKYIVEDRDFLFSWSGSLLATFWTGGRGALNQHLFKVSSAKYPSWFYSQWVWHHMKEFQSIAASKATTMGHIQRGHLSAAETICPPSNTLKAIGETMEPLQDLILANLLQSRTLVETRDLLLPKLMSGRSECAMRKNLRVATCERQLVSRHKNLLSVLAQRPDAAADARRAGARIPVGQ